MPARSAGQPVAPGRGLHLEAVSVGYRDGRRTRTVLSQVCVLARPGEFTALVGPNGTGKSTLLRTIAGLQPPLAGHSWLDGVSLHRLSAADRSRLQAVVLTERVAPGRLSAREMVALGRHPHTGFLGRLTVDDERIVDDALADVGATSLAHRDLAELSDGERQRVMTARALAQQPRLLLMDEPSAFLDAPGRVGLMGLVRRIAVEHDVVAIVSTHEIELALQVADRLWLLDRDGVLHGGTPEELSYSGLLGEVFNSPDLVFDAVSGGFTLTGGERGTVRVSGPGRPELHRLLSRRGWRVRQDGPASIEVTAVGDTTWRLLVGGRSRDADGFEDLAHLLAQPQDTRGLSRVSAESVRAAAQTCASLGPYFSTELSAPGEFLQDLAPSQIRAWVEQTCERLGTHELRVGASTWQFSLVARLWSFMIGCWITSGILPDLLETGYHHGPDGMRLTPAATGGWCDEAADADTVAELMAEQVWSVAGPVHQALRQGVPVAAGLLEGNCAAAAVGALRAARGHSTCAESAGLLPALLATRLIAPHLDRTADAGLRRRSCCLFYRTPQGGTCGDCPLDPTSTPPRPRLDPTSIRRPENSTPHP